MNAYGQVRTSRLRGYGLDLSSILSAGKAFVSSAENDAAQVAADAQGVAADAQGVAADANALTNQNPSGLGAAPATQTASSNWGLWLAGIALLGVGVAALSKKRRQRSTP